MKNHLSTLPSIDAGGKSSFLGMCGSLLGSTRSGEWGTVTLVLQAMINADIRSSCKSLQSDVTPLSLASDQLLPGFSTLAHNVGSISMGRTH